MEKILVPVGLSNKHLHLSEEHVKILFGEGYEFTWVKDLTQPGQFACEERVDVVGPKGTLKGLRVLGPARKETQIEILLADSFVLGLNPPVRESGNLEGSPGAKLIGPKGEVTIEKGVIVARRHIHMLPPEAEKIGVVDKQMVSVKVGGERGLIFDNVMVRVTTTSKYEFHADLEEGNAAGLKNGDVVEIIK
jgi:putative phosphotransacetylase